MCVVSSVQTHTAWLSCTKRLVCELWRTETCLYSVYKVENGFPLVCCRSARGWGFPWAAFDSCTASSTISWTVQTVTVQEQRPAANVSSWIYFDIPKQICHHPVRTFPLCQAPRMNFNDVVANNWKKDQILRFLLLQNPTFWSIKKIRMKFTTEYTCSHPYKRFCTRISSVFIIIVVEAVVWSHGRNMDSKKKRKYVFLATSCK